MNITCPHCARLTSTPVDILATRAACDYCGKLFSLDALPTMVPTAAATSAELLAGQRLGGCRIVRMIGVVAIAAGGCHTVALKLD